MTGTAVRRPDIVIGWRPSCRSTIGGLRLAFILAVLGVPSLGITIPAAIGSVSARSARRLSSGAEPAMGFIALVIAGLDVMMLNAVLLKTLEILDPVSLWTGIGWGVLLATAAGIRTASTLRIHRAMGRPPSSHGQD